MSQLQRSQIQRDAIESGASCLLIAVVFATLMIIEPVTAGSVRMSWDASTTPGVTYRIYAHTNKLTESNLTNAVIQLDTGTNRVVQIDDLQQDFWWFAVTAIKDELESAPSNIIVSELPNEPKQSRAGSSRHPGRVIVGRSGVGGVLP